MRQTDYHHNTDDQVRGYLERALALTDELDPPADLRGIVFTKACDLFASKQVILEQTAMVGRGLGLLGNH